MSIRVMKLVLFALVLLSSAVSSNCELIEIVYLDNECKFLNKLITQPTLINFRIYIYILLEFVFSIVRI
jgi:hypothetical protein